MSAFLQGGGVDCGPANVLKDVSTRVDRDTSAFQDRLVSVPNVAGSSRQPFRSVQTVTPQVSSVPAATAQPFDLSSLQRHLDLPSSSFATPQPQQAARAHPQGTSQWANAFHAQAQGVTPDRMTQQMPASYYGGGWGREYASFRLEEQQRARSASPALHQSSPLGSAQLQPFRPAFQAGPPPWIDQHYQNPHAALLHHPVTPHLFHQTRSAPQTTSSATPTQENINTPSEPLTDSQDLLARTARSFVDELENSSDILTANPKLAQSNFMALLRGIGNEGIVVQEDEGALQEAEGVGEGARFVSRSKVQADWAGDFMATSQASTASTSQTGQTSAVQNQDNVAARSPYPQGLKTYPALDSWAQNAFPIAQQVPPPVNMADQWERQFRDQEALVRSTEASSTRSTTQDAPQRRKSVHFTESSAYQLGGGVPNNLEEALASRTAIPGAGAAWEDPTLDDGLDAFDEETFALFNGVMRQAQDRGIGIGAREGWGEMQDDWERFQRAEPRQKGLRGMGRGDRVERYLFQGQNPYALGMGSEGQVLGGSLTLKGILELEAAVQHDPTSHESWYALGLKQQENEREDQAILALSKVVQLEPDYRPAYLALAVSYTNENESEAACTMIERWIRLGEGQSAVPPLESAGDMGREKVYAGREELIGRLIEIARQSPEVVDADVQEALGVLFNASEDYQKAEDCFSAALSVKPEDWLLYNRLGATLANSGRSNEAIQYYHKALSLHPNFVRALFNLSISYINLGQYTSAAQSALDALRLQHADTSEGYASAQSAIGAARGVKGVTSEALWNTLRGACLHMSRTDLAELVDKRDLSGFPMTFTNELGA